MKPHRPFEEIARMIDGLGLWKAFARCNIGIRPHGTVFPYFCTAFLFEGGPVRVRLIMFEGWQTFHDFVHMRVDPDFGFYLTPAELPQFELMIPREGPPQLFRHDPGYMPITTDARQKELVERILWEIYGFLLRYETDRNLPMKFAAERAMFARAEKADGSWCDQALTIPEPRPYSEKCSFPNDLLRKAKDLPIDPARILEVDLCLLADIMTNEPRPRCVFNLRAVDGTSGEKIIDDRASVLPETGLRGIWEALPAQVLKQLVLRGQIPGMIKVRTKRMFRLMRPLCIELPIKLSLHDRLPKLDEAPSGDAAVKRP